MCLPCESCRKTALACSTLLCVLESIRSIYMSVCYETYVHPQQDPCRSPCYGGRVSFVARCVSFCLSVQRSCHACCSFHRPQHVAEPGPASPVSDSLLGQTQPMHCKCTVNDMNLICVFDIQKVNSHDKCMNA